MSEGNTCIAKPNLEVLPLTGIRGTTLGGITLAPARLKSRVTRLKARVGRLKAQVRRLKARVEAIKPRVR